jgi:hypothetical protein
MPSGIIQMSESARQSDAAEDDSGKKLNAEAGDQGVKWRDGFRTSRGAESHRTIIFEGSTDKNIERYCSDPRPYFLIGAVPQQPQDAVADVTGTGFGARESSASAVGSGMVARSAMTVSHAMHYARGLHHPHALTSRPAELGRHLPGYQQEQEYRQCRFVPH